jgi:hypothetical protein
MTTSARIHHWYSLTESAEIRVRTLRSGSRIVSHPDGWVVRVDSPEHGWPADRDRHTVALAHSILRWRRAGKTLKYPWGRIIKYGKGRH